MGTLDTYITIGEETEYGVLAPALTRGIEGHTDPGKRLAEYQVSNGMRPGFHGTRADRRRKVDMGAEGDLEVDLLDRGMGMLLKAMIGGASLVEGPPNKQVFKSTPEGPTTSLSVQVARGVIGAGIIPNTYLGGMCKSWELSQKVGGEDSQAKLKLAMDYAEEDSEVEAATAVYPAAQWIYGWQDLVVTVDGDEVPNLDFTLSVDNGLRTDWRRTGTTKKRKPYRNQVPTYGGSFSTDYEGDILYDLFRVGDHVPIVATYSASATQKLVVTMAGCLFTGDTPVVQKGSSTQSAPFAADHAAGTDLLTVEYLTADTAY